MEGTMLAAAYTKFEADYSQYMRDTEKVVKEAEKAYNKISGEMQKVEDQINKTAKAAENLSKSFTVSFKGAVGAVSSLINPLDLIYEGIMGIASKALSVFSFAIQSAGKVGISVLKNLLKLVGDLYKSIMKAAKGIVTTLISLPRLAVTVFKKMRNYVNEWTKTLVFANLDLRYIIDNFRTASVVLGGLVGGATAASATFENAFVKVRKVVDMTSTEVERLSDNIQELSTRIEPSANELSEMTAVAGQLGIRGVQNLTDFTEVMAKLAITTNIVGQQGSAQFARLMKIMDVSQDEMENMGSSLVALGNNFAAFEDEILELSFRLAGAGDIIGLSVQEIFALSTAMSVTGVKAERGGTAVSRIMMEMANAVATGSEELEGFAEISNTTIEDFSNTVEKNPIRAIQSFIEGLQRIDEAGGNVFEALERVNVNQVRSRDVILRLVSSNELLYETIETSNHAYERNEALARESAIAHETLWTQIKLLKDTFLEFARDLGDLFLPEAKETVQTAQTMLDAFRDLDADQLKVIKNFAKLTAAVVGTTTAFLMGVRAVLTFLTGATLLIRFGLLLTPFVGILWAIGSALAYVNEKLDMTPTDTVEAIRKGFVNLGEGLAILWENLKESSIGQAFDKMLGQMSSSWEDFANKTRDLLNMKDQEPGVFSLNFASNLVTTLSEGTQAVRGFTQDVSKMLKDVRKNKDFDNIFERMFDNYTVVPSGMTKEAEAAMRTQFGDMGTRVVTEEEHQYIKAFEGLYKSLSDLFSNLFRLLAFDAMNVLSQGFLTAMSLLKEPSKKAAQSAFNWFKEEWIALNERFPAWSNTLDNWSDSINKFTDNIDFSDKAKEGWLSGLDISDEQKDLLKSFANFGWSIIKLFGKIGGELLRTLTKGVEWEKLGDVLEQSLIEVDWGKVGRDISEDITSGFIAYFGSGSRMTEAMISGFTAYYGAVKDAILHNDPFYDEEKIENFLNYEDVKNSIEDTYDKLKDSKVTAFTKPLEITFDTFEFLGDLIKYDNKNKELEIQFKKIILDVADVLWNLPLNFRDSFLNTFFGTSDISDVREKMSPQNIIESLSDLLKGPEVNWDKQGSKIDKVLSDLKKTLEVVMGEPKADKKKDSDRKKDSDKKKESDIDLISSADRVSKQDSSSEKLRNDVNKMSENQNKMQQEWNNVDKILDSEGDSVYDFIETQRKLQSQVYLEGDKEPTDVYESADILSDAKRMFDDAINFFEKHSGVRLSKSDLEKMAKMVYLESVGQPFEGQVGVASNILNRIISEKYPDNAEDVLFQKRAYSSYPERWNKPENEYSSTKMARQMDAVIKALYGAIPDMGSTHYANLDVVKDNPNWDQWWFTPQYQPRAQIGEHNFGTEPRFYDEISQILALRGVKDPEKKAEKFYAIGQQEQEKLLAANTQQEESQRVMKNFETYSVKQGESAWNIAQELGVTVDQLEQWNTQIEDINSLQIGDKIKYIPTFMTYVVQAGDTFSEVADELGVTVEQLKKWNTKIDDINNLQIGDKLKYRSPGNPNKFASGTILPGYKGGDRIPALLEGGEAVVPADVVKSGVPSIIQWFKSMGAVKLAQGAVGSQSSRVTSVGDSAFDMLMSTVKKENYSQSSQYTYSSGSSNLDMSVFEDQKSLMDDVSKQSGVQTEEMETLNEQILTLRDSFIGVLDSATSKLTVGLKTSAEWLADILRTVFLDAPWVNKVDDWVEEFKKIVDRLAGVEKTEDKDPGGQAAQFVMGFLEEEPYKPDLSIERPEKDKSQLSIAPDLEKMYYDFEWFINEISKDIKGGSLAPIFDIIENITSYDWSWINIIEDIGSWFTKDLMSIFNNIIEAVEGIDIASKVDTMTEFILNPIDSIIKGFKDISDNIDWKKVKGWIDTSISQLNESVTTGVKIFGDSLKELFTSALPEGLTKAVIDRASILSSAVQGASEGAKDGGVAGGMAGAFIGFITHSKAFGKIIESVNPFLEELANLLGAVLLPVFKLLSPVLKALTDFIRSIIEGIVKYWNKSIQLLESVINFFAKFIGKEVNFDSLKISLDDLTGTSKELNEELKAMTHNLPKGFRVNLEKYHAANVQNIPSAQIGGFVTSAGLVRVHKGEYITPGDTDNRRTQTVNVKIGNVIGDSREIKRVVYEAVKEAEQEEGTRNYGVPKSRGNRYR